MLQHIQVFRPVCAGTEWVYENPRVALSPGDVVNYWFLVITSMGGYNNLNKAWTVPGT